VERILKREKWKVNPPGRGEQRGSDTERKGDKNPEGRGQIIKKNV